MGENIKIGIMTFHRACNYGAQLQCYSLFLQIKNRFPNCTVEVIDYESSIMKDYYSLTGIGKIKVLLSSVEKTNYLLKAKILTKWFLDQLRRKKNYETAFSKKRNDAIISGLHSISLSNQSIVGDSNQFLSVFGNKYDIIIVGSDAVWNDKQVESPNPYYLDGVSAIKMSYAASSYGMDYLAVSSSESRPDFSSFEYLGVRDTATYNYVKKCTPTSIINHNCDPSIFLDLEGIPVSTESVRNKLSNKGVDLTKPIVGLMCDDWLAKKVRDYLGDQFQYVAVYCWNNYSDYYLDDLTPFEWAVVFRFFVATFTHFFHGTLFSLKNHTMTFSVEKKTTYSSKYSTKIVDVLNRLDLMDIHYYEDELSMETWGTIAKKIETGKDDMFDQRIDHAFQEEALSSNSFFEKLKDLLNGANGIG